MKEKLEAVLQISKLIMIITVPMLLFIKTLSPLSDIKLFITRLLLYYERIGIKKIFLAPGGNINSLVPYPSEGKGE